MVCRMKCQVWHTFLHVFSRNSCNRNVTKIRHISATSSSVLQSISSPKEVPESKWESVVGLEIHAQIHAHSKLFSSSGTIFGAPTNTQVSYFDAALPGTLPVLNKYCVEAGVLTALALNCTINKTSSFDRKHYFYSDLPAGYQITQQFQPLATNGYLDFYVYDTDYHIKPYKCRTRLKQLQLEQDSGRSLHMESKKTFIDLNRAGIGLMELVFEPDLKNGREAAMLVRELQLILKALGTCNGVMEEGALRVDANISVNKVGEPWGVRTEVKNINSHRFVSRAIDFEINRQIEALENGGIIYNETRSFDYKSRKTVFMRDKERFQDYRFMPEPNLPTVRLYDDSDVFTSPDASWVLNIDDLKKQMPALPSQERARLMEQYGISYENSDKLVKEEGMKTYFEAVASTDCDSSYAFGFVTNNVRHQLNILKLSFKDCPVHPNKVKELVYLVNSMTISDATANDMLEMFFSGDERFAKEIVECYNWFLISDEKELESICRELISEMPKVVKKYKSSQKRKFMTSLLENLNHKVNDRAHIKTAEAVLVRLIMGESKGPSI